ncbi:GNAT family N-acetyltransferase [Wenyingzhuangia sp. IMCC45574]
MENSFPILETERLILRQFSMEDLNHVFKGLSHPEVIKYYGINFTSLEKTKEQIQWFQQLEKEESGIW